MTRNRWLTLRRASQLVFLFLFVFLLLRTEYRGFDVIRYPVNTFFQLDPLLGLTTLLGLREAIAHFWPALITIAVTLVLGRVFCGWFCPLGATLDVTRRLLGKLPAAHAAVALAGAPGQVLPARRAACRGRLQLAGGVAARPVQPARARPLGRRHPGCQRCGERRLQRDLLQPTGAAAALRAGLRRAQGAGADLRSAVLPLGLALARPARRPCWRWSAGSRASGAATSARSAGCSRSAPAAVPSRGG